MRREKDTDDFGSALDIRWDVPSGLVGALWRRTKTVGSRSWTEELNPFRLRNATKMQHDSVQPAAIAVLLTRSNSGIAPCWSAVDVLTHKLLIYLVLLVPGERFELPTNGLQNRCSTTELTRLISC